MDKPKFVYVTYIATTPEKLWEALTNGDFTEKYWFGSRIQPEWKVGSQFKILTCRAALENRHSRSASKPTVGWLWASVNDHYTKDSDLSSG